MKVSELIRKLERQNPDAVVVWNGNTSCVSHALDAGLKAAKARDLGRGLYSLIGGDRSIPVVLVDIENP